LDYEQVLITILFFARWRNLFGRYLINSFLPEKGYPVGYPLLFIGFFVFLFLWFFSFLLEFLKAGTERVGHLRTLWVVPASIILVKLIPSVSTHPIDDVGEGKVAPAGAYRMVDISGLLQVAALDIKIILCPLLESVVVEGAARIVLRECGATKGDVVFDAQLVIDTINAKFPLVPQHPLSLLDKLGHYLSGRVRRHSICRQHYLVSEHFVNLESSRRHYIVVVVVVVVVLLFCVCL